MLLTVRPLNADAKGLNDVEQAFHGRASGLSVSPSSDRLPFIAKDQEPLSPNREDETRPFHVARSTALTLARV